MSKFTALKTDERRRSAYALRIDASAVAAQRPHDIHRSNCEEANLLDDQGEPTYAANFTKGMPHHPVAGDSGGSLTTQQQQVAGLVRGGAYATLLRALESRNSEDFERIARSPETEKHRKWVNPQAGVAFDLEGPDAAARTIPPAPCLDSRELAGEMAEVYWMALLRDVEFESFAGHDLAKAGYNDLHHYPQYAHLKPDGSNLFRTTEPGVDKGPHLSQFLLLGNKDAGMCEPLPKGGARERVTYCHGLISYGTLKIDQRSRVQVPYLDYMTDPQSWLEVQNGEDKIGHNRFDPQRRFLRTPRDIASYVHFDQLYQAYLNACLYLLSEMSGSLDSSCIPPGERSMGGPTFDLGKGNPYRDYERQDAFGTLGGAYILSLVTEVATRALKAIWYQKWFVHRRLRPEAMSARVHFTKLGWQQHPLDPDLLNSDVMDLIAQHNAKQNNGAWRDAVLAAWPPIGEVCDPPTGNLPPPDHAAAEASYLLPMAFAEGSPMHPSYGAGHATVAAACSTILKSFFHGCTPLPHRVTVKKSVPVAGDPTRADLFHSLSGQELEDYEGDELTVEGELNKLASNIAMARNMAGVHYLTDWTASRTLGEQIAIGLLQEQSLTFNEERLTGEACGCGPIVPDDAGYNACVDSDGVVREDGLAPPNRVGRGPIFAFRRFDGRTVEIELGRIRHLESSALVDENTTCP